MNLPSRSVYRYMLAEPGTPHRRGKGKSPGLVMAAFGDLGAGGITTRQSGEGFLVS